ncbi:hypothetical protein FEM48_Zijuj02G0042100 [Ziziphus jujuba var. spinosa]|uniref:Letm1 RBD domain-containing protein n=1 Tax=Ziziphus jujuba var. spinosa TaxID=714518 RepID=A0A978VTJ9_ZIZJJ|nr:hypothetical protein FEM48_Zijuj02G0042100 [Ziziphus jujuba var. spinosa]
MASRAILQRKRYLFNSLNQPNGLVRGFFSFEHGQLSQSDDLGTVNWVASQPSATTDCRSESSGGKNALSAFIASGSFNHSFFRTSTLGNGIGRAGVVSPLGVRWTLQSIRYISTASAGQPEFGSSGDRNGQKVSAQKKEPSPEECDQAVEGLSTVKAKAKAKQIQESEKDAKSFMITIWSKLLGIGPALKAVASMSREDWAKKFSHWKDEFKSTMQHYWLGTKLLWADIRISSRLLLKLASGKSLSRREKQQLTRTTADIFRLVPFAVFIIVPFMEFLLPVFLKLFPNMLPSTFQDKMKEEVRKGVRVSNDEILGFAKLFNDELTLDNISRPRLVNMCKYMGIRPYGTDAYLRYQLRKRLREIKTDDRMIQAEGIESLSERELVMACRDRGLLRPMSVEEMRQELRDWLDLSLNHFVPSSLLILSRAFSVHGKVKPEEAVQATLSSLPDEVVDTVGVTALPSEDSVAERRRKLEFLEMQEELIKDSVSRQTDVALEEMTTPTAREAQEQKGKILDKHEQLCELSRALAVLASASSVSREREEFLRLVNKEVELYNSIVEKGGTEGEEQAKIAYKAARKDSDQAAEMAKGDKVSTALIDRVDAMLQKLEKEIDDVDAKIGDRWRLLDRIIAVDMPWLRFSRWLVFYRDYDGKVTPEEVASAANYLKDTLGKEGIQELIGNLSKDREGKIRVEDIIKLGFSTEEADAEEARK